MNELSQEYLSYIEAANGDEAGRRAFRKKLESGQAYWNGHVKAASYLPMCLSEEDRKKIADSCGTLHRILAKAIGRYRQDPLFRREFRFDERVRELLSLPSLCPADLPLMRADMIYDPGTGNLSFCEFNTAASGGMTETRETVRAVRCSDPCRKFALRHSIHSDEDSVLTDWVRVYRKLCPLKASGEKPHLAILVLLDSGEPDVSTLLPFVSLFEEAGFEVTISDVRDLTYENGLLVGKKTYFGRAGRPIDSIWRFLIVVDLLQHWEEIAPFRAAVRDGNIPMISDFSDQIAADKQIFAVLGKCSRDEIGAEWLTEEEKLFIREHLPYTAFIDEMGERLDEVRQNPEGWILKPADWYSSIGVTAGSTCSYREWNDLIDEALTRTSSASWLLQEAIPPVTFSCIPIYGKEEDYYREARPFGGILGAYVYGGTFSGIYLRQGPEVVIGDARQGVTSSVLWCGEKENVHQDHKD